MIDNSQAISDELAHSERPNGYKHMNIAEMEATLDACLHVQRWSRAFTLLSQLSVLLQNNQQRLLDIHNRVLGAMAEDLLRNQNYEHAPRINDWVEVVMRKAGVKPDAHTFALKLKVALDSLHGSKRDRTVQRYWEMTKHYRLESEVYSLRDILTERDLGYLSEICPHEVKAPQDKDVAGTSLRATSVESKVDAENGFEIRQTEQKGLGLATLKKSIHALSSQEAVSPEVDPIEDPLFTRQRKLEREGFEIALQRWKAEYKMRATIGAVDLSHGMRGGLLWIWHESLASKITKELELVKEAESITGRKSAQEKLRLEYGPLLACLPPAKVAATSLIAIMNLYSRSGVANPVKLARLVTDIGRAIEDEYHADTMARESQALLKSHKKKPKGGDEEWLDTKPVQLFRRSGHHSAKSYKYGRNWTNIQHAKLGAIVCELMFDAARMEISKLNPTTQKYVSIAQPVFSRTTIWQNGRRIGVVSMLEEFAKLLISQPAEHVVAKQLPMICPPKPWTGFSEGGFLQSKQPFLRVKAHEIAQRQYAEAAADRGDLDQLFAGIDVLSQTGWRINKQVFTVMVEAWNGGNEIANFPPLEKVFPKPEAPGPNATPKERWQWFQNLRKVANEKSGIHSERCFQNLQMEIAKSYLNETFYLPHNIDFRGRAYPIPPYLNQMGADNCRGLLLFDKGRELGSEGLRWLKIHLSNVYGYDKASLADRAQFPMDHLDKIYDSVRRPLNGEQWWLTAEDPWQCLATCFELTNALDSPDPTKFVSRLPVHQDGSCNGLQHYAALGGDVAGAKQVNLEPGDLPSDVYTGVCELVKAAIKEDSAQGLAIAKQLEGRVTRKVVKQTVMTNVYGVTFLGARRQVQKQLDALMPDLAKEQISGKAATYIAKNIFRGLGTLFTGAHQIQYWLGDCANRISSSISPFQMDKMYIEAYGNGDSVPEGKIADKRQTSKKAQKQSYESDMFRTSVIWTTPLKLPVVQPYRVNKSQSIQTNLQHISLAQPSVADVVNKRKQLQAFPPNFVHSLDACHMALSALRANELGLSFSAVHDSFWTHASDINALNTLLREAFIQMHSEDIVGRLLAEFQKRYEGHYYLAQINKSNKLGKALAAYRKRMASEGLLPPGHGFKGISERRHAELLRETRKMKLMASEDAKEREEGEKMVTAATLFEELDGEKYLFSRNSLGETAIGTVPDNVDESVLEQAMHSEDAVGDVNLARTLDPLKDSVAEVDEEETVDETDTQVASTAEDPLMDLHRRNAFGDKMPKKATAKSINNQMWLWLPLKFKPVPKKGDFDVRRLRDSTYFFS